MKMGKIHTLSLLVLFLLVSCGSDDIDKNIKPKAAVSETANINIQDTYLKGKIVGDFNGKYFLILTKKNAQEK